MDWTTPLKSQQADFIKRLTADIGKLLHCSIKGCNTELMTLTAGDLQQTAHSGQTSLHTPALFNSLQQQLAQTAMIRCLDGLVTPVDPAKSLEKNCRVHFTLTADTSVGIHIKIASTNWETLQWSIVAAEVQQNAVIACLWLVENAQETPGEFQVVLAGFIPTHLIELSAGKAILKITDLLYGGGLRSYLESLPNQEPTGQWLRTLMGGSNYVYPFAIGSQGEILASSGYDGTIKLWNVNQEGLKDELANCSWSFYPVAGGNGGQSLASGSTEKKLNLWQMGTGKLIRSLPGHTSGVSAIAIAQNNPILASGGYDGTINLWQLDTGHLMRSLAGHTGTVRPITLSADGKLLASGGIDKLLKLWDVQTGQVIRIFPTHTDSIISLAMNPDDQLLVSGTQDGMIKIWHLHTGELLHAIAAHSGLVRSVAFSYDGSTLATSSLEKTIKLWNLQTGDLVRTLTGHSDPMISFSINPQEQTLDLSLFRYPQPGWSAPSQWQ